MVKRIASGIMLMLLLATMLTLAFNIAVLSPVLADSLDLTDVILEASEEWYTTNDTMDNTEGKTYVGEIPGFEADTHGQYKIIAYDNAGNPAVDDNAGSYYVYTVIPEFPSIFLLLLFVAAALSAVWAHRRKQFVIGHE